MLLQDIESRWDIESENFSNTSKRYVLKDLLQEHMPNIEGRNLRVLDIGYGSEHLAVFMASLGHNITSIDCSEGILNKSRKGAREYAKLIKFKVMDAQSLQFKDNTFDLIVSKNLMGSIQYPEIAYKEWYRVLAPGGKIINFDSMEITNRNSYFSQIERPSWDIDKLLQLGFNKISIKNNISNQSLQADEPINYSESLLFMIAATK